jgi:DNA-binding CsgD family transcriptional regulator
MTNSLRRVEYNVIPGKSPHNKHPLRFSFLSSVPSLDVDPNPLYYQDESGIVQGCNRSFEILMKKERCEVVGKTLDEVFPQKVVPFIQQSFNEMLHSVSMKQFVMPMPAVFSGESSETPFFLITMSCSKIDLGRKLVFSTLTDISGMPIHMGLASVDEHFEKNILPAFSTRPESPPPFELLLRSEKMKNQWLDWLGRLDAHLNAEGKSILSSIMRRVKYELHSEINLRAERAFDEEHRALYKFLEKQPSRITRNEMRVCALLQEGNSPIEIARRMGKSANSINVTFVRIRSKLRVNDNKELKTLLTNGSSNVI